MNESITKIDLSNIEDGFVISNPCLKKMHQEADEIQRYMEEDINLEDVMMLPDRLNRLDAYLHRMSDMLTRAKAMKEYAKMTFVSQNEQALSKMTATNSNRLLSAALYEFTVTTDRMDSMYSSLTQACRNLSIQMSWIKKTMELGG